MSEVLRLLFAWVAFGSSYVLLITLDLPRPRYLPEAGVISLEAPPGVIAMGWYGALLVASVLALLTHAGLGRWRLRLGPATERRLVALGVLLLAGQLLGLAWFELQPR